MRRVHYSMSILCDIFVDIRETGLALIFLLIESKSMMVVKKARCSVICILSSK